MNRVRRFKTVLLRGGIRVAGGLALLILLAGVSFVPGQSVRGVSQVTFYMQPSSGYTNEFVRLTCGWHTGACDSQAETGWALDFDETSTLSVSARAWVWWPDAVGYPYVAGSVVDGVSSSGSCDYVRVKVFDNFSPYRDKFRMMYMHAAPTGYSGPSFPASSGWPGYYTSSTVGTMVWDTGCTGQWYHVHEIHDGLWNGATVAKGPNLPNGDYCLWDGNGSDCLLIDNDNNTTRYFQYPPMQ